MTTLAMHRSTMTDYIPPKTPRQQYAAGYDAAMNYKRYEDMTTAEEQRGYLAAIKHIGYAVTVRECSGVTQ